MGPQRFCNSLITLRLGVTLVPSVYSHNASRVAKLSESLIVSILNTKKAVSLARPKGRIKMASSKLRLPWILTRLLCCRLEIRPSIATYTF